MIVEVEEADCEVLGVMSSGAALLVLLGGTGQLRGREESRGLFVRVVGVRCGYGHDDGSLVGMAQNQPMVCGVGEAAMFGRGSRQRQCW